MNEVYHMIEKSSKILLPGPNNDYELYKEPKVELKPKTKHLMPASEILSKSIKYLFFTMLALMVIIAMGQMTDHMF